MQRSSKAVQSSFRANMRAVKDGSVTVSATFIRTGVWLLTMFGALPLIVLVGAAGLWILVNFPFPGLLLLGALFAARMS